MWKRIFVYAVIGFSIIFIILQISVLFQMMFTMDSMNTAVVPGEEDVVIRNGNTDKNLLTITCNVDWGEDVLPEMLDILKEKDVKITYFVSGKWAEKNPYLLRKMYIAGHEIQSHGYAHKLCSNISAEEVRNEMKKTESIIFELLGVRTSVFAPPSGDYDVKTVNICREEKYKLSLWSSDTIDWRKDSTSEVILKRVFSKPLKGAIILMHPKEETVKALPELIDKIQKKGYVFVPLNELMIS